MEATRGAVKIPAGFARLALPPSGYLETNGPFYVRREHGDVRIGMRIEQRHANSIGIAHGGMIMTLADIVLTVGSNIKAELSRFLPTVSMSCDFIAPAKVGEWIEGEINVAKVTRTHVFSSVLLQTADAVPVARASAVLLLRGEPDPRFAPERYFTP